MSLRSLILASAFLVTATATAADWPQWRGPTRDGVSTETGLLKAWPEGGPKVVWTAKKLGLGFGTPTVADGKIFGIGSRDGKDGIWALKESDGSEIWFTEFTATPKVFQQMNGPASSPAYANGKVYAVSLGGTLICADAATGNKLWTKEYLKDFGGAVPTWGYADSVLVDGDQVVCVPCGTKGAVAALKADTGDVVWAAVMGKIGTGAKDGGAGYSSPIKATVAGVPMYLVVLDQKNGLVGLDPKTGKTLWQYTKAAMGGVAQIPTPIVSGDLVWHSTAYGGGSAVLKLVKDGDKFKVEEVKTTRTELMNHHGGAVLVDGHVYFGSGQNQGFLACVELKTGALKWGPEKNATTVGGGQGSAAVLYADGRIYYRYQNGTMVLVEPSPEGLKVASSFKLPPADSKSHPQSWPHPVIVNGKMLVRDQNVMYAYDIKAK